MALIQKYDGVPPTAPNGCGICHNVAADKPHAVTDVVDDYGRQFIVCRHCAKEIGKVFGFVAQSEVARLQGQAAKAEEAEERAERAERQLSKLKHAFLGATGTEERDPIASGQTTEDVEYIARGTADLEAERAFDPVQEALKERGEQRAANNSGISPERIVSGEDIHVRDRAADPHKEPLASNPVLRDENGDVPSLSDIAKTRPGQLHADVISKEKESDVLNPFDARRGGVKEDEEDEAVVDQNVEHHDPIGPTDPARGGISEEQAEALKQAPEAAQEAVEEAEKARIEANKKDLEAQADPAAAPNEAVAPVADDEQARDNAKAQKKADKARSSNEKKAADARQGRERGKENDASKLDQDRRGSTVQESGKASADKSAKSSESKAADKKPLEQ